MNMNIYITPRNESLLKEYHRQGESMSGLINRLLMYHFDDIKLESPEKQAPPKKIETPKPAANQLSVDDLLAEPKKSVAARDRGEDQAAIRAYEAEMEEAIRFNQDPDSRRLMETEYRKTVQDMWNEYHEYWNA